MRSKIFGFYKIDIKMLMPGLIVSIIILFFSNVNAQDKVHNRTTSVGYDTIGQALGDALSGHLIEVDPGTYTENVLMSTPGVTLRATAWTQSNDNTVTIIDANNGQNAVWIGSIADVVIQGFTIQNASDGLALDGSIRAEIRNCRMVSNFRGIRINTSFEITEVLIHSNYIAHNGGSGMVPGKGDTVLCTVSYNTFCSNKEKGIFNRWDNFRFIGNKVYHNGHNATGGNDGVEDRGNGNEYIDNIIYDNYLVGIKLDTADNCLISGNVIYNNSAGINFVVGSPNVIITNNIIYSNANPGISIGSSMGQNTRIVDNEIFGNSKGINLNGNSGIIMRGNNIYNSTLNGIDITDLSGGMIELNTVKNSINNGIIISGTAAPPLIKNNIYNNGVNILNNTATVLDIKNHWWGTTIESNIHNKINSASGYDASNYRLFGEFDLTYGADTDRLPAITWVQLYSNSSSGGMGVIWSKPASTSDFTRYFVYKTKDRGIENLSPVNILTQINDVNTTNYTDLNASFSTQYFYHITSLDNHPVYTNESWYSVEALPPFPFPRVPRNFKAELAADDYESIDLSWGDVLSETSYTLYRSTSRNVTNVYTDLPKNISSYRDTGLALNTTYYYWLQAFSDQGGSGYTVVASNTTPPSMSPPEAPSFINAEALYSDVIVTWENVDNESSYTLYLSTNNFITTNSNVGLSKNITNYTYPVSGALYYYHKVKACNPGGDSPDSQISIASYPVFNRTQVRSYMTITNALNDALPGDLIEAEIGTYYESLFIAVSGITLRAIAWTQSGDNTSTIIDSGGSPKGVIIGGYSDVVLQGFAIKNAGEDGVVILGSIRPEIRNCNIISNGIRGINLQNPSPSDILIYSNFIAHNGVSGIVPAVSGNGLCSILENIICSNGSRGISSKENNYRYTGNRIFNNDEHGIEENGDGNDWIDNIIYNNGSDGMRFNLADTGYVSGNIIFNNANGIYLQSQSPNITITNNTIFSNISGTGIFIGDNNNNIKMVDNDIYNNLTGINVGVNSGIIIKWNNVYNSAVRGLVIDDLTSSVIELNTFKESSGTGIIVNGNIVPVITKNNIFNNAVNLSNNSLSIIIITNNWWGSVTGSVIDSKITGNSTYNASNYRLFGEFDIEVDADTDRMPGILLVTVDPNEYGHGLLISWTKALEADNFGRYFVYRSMTPDTSNLSRMNVITQINDVNELNFVDQSVVNETEYFYFVTALDKYPVYTNESWYSVPGSGTLSAAGISIFADDFLLQYYNGSYWETIKRYIIDINLTNNIFYSNELYVDRPENLFPTNMNLRFLSDCSGDNDDVYIDEVYLYGFATNEPPAAVADYYAVDQDGILNIPAPGILSNDSDYNGDAIELHLASDPTQGHLDLQTNGSFTYTPTNGYYGYDHFSYYLNDGMEDGNTVEVEITVNFIPNLATIIISNINNNDVFGGCVTPVIIVSNLGFGKVWTNTNGSSYHGGQICREGFHTLQVIASNGEGIVTNITVFGIDQTAPVITINGIWDNDCFPSGTTATYGMIDANPYSNWALLNGSDYVSGTPIPNGTGYTLKVYAQDVVNNISSSNIYNFCIFAEYPGIEITATGVPTVNKPAPGGSFPVTFSGSSTGSNMQIGGSDPGDGNLVMRVLEEDVTNFFNPGVDIGIEIVNANIESAVRKLNGNDCPSRFVINERGYFEIYVWCNNDEDNTRKCDKAIILIDDEKPVIKVDSSRINYCRILEIEISDDFLDIDSIEINEIMDRREYESEIEVIEISKNRVVYNLMLIGNRRGKYNVSVSASDKSGNIQEFRSPTYMVNTVTTNVIKKLSVEEGECYTNDVVLDVEIAKCAISSLIELNDEEIRMEELPVVLSEDNKYNLHVKAEYFDMELGIRKVKDENVNFCIDRKAPVVEVDGVEDRNIYSRADIEVKVFEDNLATNSKVVYDGNNYELEEIDNPAEDGPDWKLNITGITDIGFHGLEYDVNDRAGWNDSGSIRFGIYPAFMASNISFIATYDKGLDADYAKLDEKNYGFETGWMSEGGYTNGCAKLEESEEDGSKSVLLYTNGLVIDGERGTISLMFRPDWNVLKANDERYILMVRDTFDEKAHEMGEDDDDFNKNKPLLYIQLYNKDDKDKVKLKFYLGLANGKSEDISIEPGTFNHGEWMHIVFTWDVIEGRMVCYIDGVREEEEIKHDQARYRDGCWIIFGASAVYNGKGNILNGSIDEVKIFDRALSEEEILHLDK